MTPDKVIIMGAPRRDFHNFNVHFRGNPSYEVVDIAAGRAPAVLLPPRAARS